MSLRLLGFSALSMVLCLAAPLPFAAGADYYVDGAGGDGLADGGKDDNKGTLDAPCLTINHGIQQLKAGDTLYIRGGEYAEHLKNTIPGGTAQARVTVSNYKDEVVTLKPKREEADNVILIMDADHSYITLKGLVVDGATVSAHPVRFTTSWTKTSTTPMTLPHHIRFENSTVRNGNKSGVITGGDNCEFINLKIEKCGKSKLSHGMYLGGDNNLIEGCEVSGSSSYGLHIYGQSGDIKNTVVRNNYLHHNKAAGVIISSINIDNVVYNNVIAHNGGGISVHGTGTKVFNNTLYGNSVGIDLTNTTNAEIRNNLICDGGGIEFGAKNTGLVLANNLVGVDPLFVDAAKGDFHLKAGSPAIGHGVAIKEVAVDRDGVARPQGVNYDVGAYEAKSGADKEPPPPPGKVLYREIFPNNVTGGGGAGGTNYISASTAGWKLNYGSKGAAYTATVSGESGRFAVSPATGAPTNLVPLNSAPNATYYTNTDDRATGYLYQASTAASGHRLFWTDEYAVDRAAVVEVEWTQNNSGGISCQVALRIKKGDAETWYVSDDALARNSWQTNSLVLATAAGWHVLNFTADKTLGIGDAAALPADGKITAFGLYTDKTDTNYSRFDSYTLRGLPPAAGSDAEPPSNDVPPVPPEVKKARADAAAAKKAEEAAAGEAAKKAAKEAADKAAADHVPVTYVVAPNGDDKNPGTEAQPWATLRKAAAEVKPGDTVRIKAGVYSRTSGGQSAFVFTEAGTKDSPITYKAYGDGEVVLSASVAVPSASWKHVKGAIYSMPFDPKAGVASIFRNGFSLVGPGQNHPIPSVDDMYPNSFYKDAEKATLYVWLADGSDPAKSDMRTTSLSVIGLSRCHNSVFEGLTLEYGARGFNVHHATSRVTIRNCVICSIAGQGIGGLGMGSVIERNVFRRIGSTKFQHAMYIDTPGLIVRNNVFEEIAGAAVHQYGEGNAEMAGQEIYGNVFRKPVQYTSPKGGRYYVDLVLYVRNGNMVYNNVFYGEGKRKGIDTNKSENRIFNNTFVGCPSAIAFGATSKDNYVQNNVFVDCEQAFVAWPQEAMPQKTLDYNIYWSNGGKPKWQCAGKDYAVLEEYQKAAGETHSRYVDPLLAGPADAHLKAGSPATDAGAVLKAGPGDAQKDIAVDIEGTPRPQGSAPDIGAYEFKGADARTAPAQPK